MCIAPMTDQVNRVRLLPHVFVHLGRLSGGVVQRDTGVTGPNRGSRLVLYGSGGVSVGPLEGVTWRDRIGDV